VINASTLSSFSFHFCCHDFSLLFDIRSRVGLSLFQLALLRSLYSKTGKTKRFFKSIRAKECNLVDFNGADGKTAAAPTRALCKLRRD
jgi:hypothetical protein